MKFKTRRLITNPVRIVGRKLEDFAQELQEWLEKLSAQVSGGIPGGFNSTTPTTVDGTTPSSPGSESDGWAAGLHQHPTDISGLPADIGSSNTQGSGPGITLSGHSHNLPFSDNLILGLSSFTRHPPRIPEVQPGTNITIAYNALGPIISAGAGAPGSPDSADSIIANQVYGG
jgi:hypothetical protein